MIVKICFSRFRAWPAKMLRHNSHSALLAVRRNIAAYQSRNLGDSESVHDVKEVLSVFTSVAT